MSSSSISNRWPPMMKHYSMFHLSTSHCKRSIRALLPCMPEKFSNMHALNASIVGIRFSVAKSTSSCSHSRQISILNILQCIKDILEPASSKKIGQKWRKNNFKIHFRGVHTRHLQIVRRSTRIVSNRCGPTTFFFVEKIRGPQGLHVVPADPREWISKPIFPLKIKSKA